MKTYDVAVVGLGAFGSAAIRALGERGLQTIGIDRGSPPHSNSSHAGKTRIVREAYHEGPFYVPMAHAAIDEWSRLNENAIERIFIPTGGLLVAPANAELLQGAKVNAESHNIPYTWIPRDDLRQRFPFVSTGPGDVGLLEERAGLVHVDLAIREFLRLAKSLGVEIDTNRAVLDWKSAGGAIEIETERGMINSKKVILCPGASLSSLAKVPDFSAPVTRQIQWWFSVDGTDTLEMWKEAPVFICQYEEGKHVYGFPSIDGSVKIGLHQNGPEVDPSQDRYPPTQPEREEILDVASRVLNLPTDRMHKHCVCAYTQSGDGHFVIDHHPDAANVIVAGAGCGHGFKFAPVVGELLADMVTESTSRFDRSGFTFEKRLGQTL